MLATVVYSVVAGWTLREIHTGAADTHALAQAADTQAKKMGNMSDAADRIRQAAEGMVTQEQRIADNARTALNASNRQSKTALDATIESSRLDQRAWIGVDQLVPQEFSETKGIRVAIVFLNSGKTPARNVQIAVRYRTSPTPIDGPLPQDIPNLVFHPDRSIAPQTRYTNFIGYSSAVGAVYSDNAIKGNQDIVSEFPLIKDKRLILYYFGILRYDDNSGRHRATQFCFFLADIDTQTLGFCNRFNDMD
jgi:hypothetical protein